MIENNKIMIYGKSKRVATKAELEDLIKFYENYLSWENQRKIYCERELAGIKEAIPETEKHIKELYAYKEQMNNEA